MAVSRHLPPGLVTPETIGNHVAPAWSPDGRSLAYFTTRPSPALGAVPLKTLTIKDLTSGTPRYVATPLAFLGGYTPEWAPDSASVAVWGSDDGRDDRLGYYRVDVQTGATSALVIRGRAELANSAVSPEGRLFFYRQPHRGIVARDLTTARERVVVDIDGGTIGSFRLAPDGRRVAFTREVGHAEGRGTTLLLQPVDGLRAREILQVDRPEQLRVHAWLPDGTRLLYTRASGNRRHQLWAVSVNDGTTTPLGVSFIRSGGSEPNGMRLSPDGRRITYAERVVQSELWIDPLVLTQTTDPPR